MHSLRLSLVLLIGLPLVACGFRPVYAPSAAEEEPVREALAAVRVEPLPGRLGYALNTALDQSLNPLNLDVPDRYRLDLAVVRDTDGLGIQFDRTITRFNLILASRIVLRDLATGEPLYAARLTRFAGYDATTEPFATLIAERDAEARLARGLAQEIELLLAAYFADPDTPLSSLRASPATP